jgi:hypothetical protein
LRNGRGDGMLRKDLFRIVFRKLDFNISSAADVAATSQKSKNK